MGNGSIYLFNFFLEAEVTLKRTVKYMGNRTGRRHFKWNERRLTPVAQRRVK